MRKSTRIVKKVLALFLVVLMSINTFGAVVSDNDGSAFITKAEFDSLKNDFQSQIDQYNTSIDAKIDGAIASYLSGISVNQTTDLMNNTSLLSYPLYMYMQNECFNISSYAEAGVKPYIGVRWMWHLMLRRNNWTRVLSGETSSEYQMCNWAYNVVQTNVETGSAVINGLIKNIDCVANLVGTVYDLTAEGTFEPRVAVGFALSTKMATAHKEAAGNNVFLNIVPTNTNLYLFDGRRIKQTDFGFNVLHFWNWAHDKNLGMKSSGTSREKYLDTWYTTNAGGWPWYESGGVGDQVLTVTTQGTAAELNKIYNNSNSDIQVPVAFDGNICMTNNQGMKHNNVNEEITSVPYSASLSWGLRQHIFLDPGLTPEPQNSGSSRLWYERSLQYPESLVYEVKGINDQKVFYQKLNCGVPLSQWPAKEVNEATIDINISSSNTSLKKYLLMSTKPIDISNHLDIDDMASTDFFRLEKGTKPTTTSHRKIELSEGNNTIYFAKDVDGGGLIFPQTNDIIYYKIIWSEPSIDYTSTSYCTVNSAPSIRVSSS